MNKESFSAVYGARVGPIGIAGYPLALGLVLTAKTLLIVRQQKYRAFGLQAIKRPATTSSTNNPNGRTKNPTHHINQFPPPIDAKPGVEGHRPSKSMEDAEQNGFTPNRPCAPP